MLKCPPTQDLDIYHTKDECNEAEFLFPPFKPPTTNLLRIQSDICAAQRFSPVGFFLLTLLTLRGQFVFLQTRTTRPPYGISWPQFRHFLKTQFQLIILTASVFKIQILDLNMWPHIT